jgi:hypothetical protein
LSVRLKLDYARPIEPVILATTVKIVRVLFVGSKVGFINAAREFLIRRLKKLAQQKVWALQFLNGRVTNKL